MTNKKWFVYCKETKRYKNGQNVLQDKSCVIVSSFVLMVINYHFDIEKTCIQVYILKLPLATIQSDISVANFNVYTDFIIDKLSAALNKVADEKCFEQI